MAEPRSVGVDRERREDPALITGDAAYTDDLAPPGAVHAAIVRSQYGHARIESIDVDQAEAREDVLAVYTAADLAASDAPGVVQVDETLPGQRAPEYPALASDVVRYAGEAVAVVVAEDRYAARDAAEAVDVAYERLEAVVDPADALADDAPLVHEEYEDNRCLDWEFGDDEAAVEEAFAAADRVVSLETEIGRVHPDALEPRGTLAAFDDGQLTVHMSTQAPYMEQDLLCETLGLDEEDVRVIAPDVGGGFGSKSLPYAEQVIVAWCSMQLERPVKWIATRTESHQADHHGRGFRVEGELALDADGSIRGFRTEALSNVGAYVVFATSPWPNYVYLASGAYEIPVIRGRIRGAFTNATPTAPYRGAGRPEIIYLIERLVNRAADELDMDPAELRRRNYVPPEAFPYETPVDTTYDSGNYQRALDKALDVVGYEDWRERQRELREEDRYVGIGISTFLENSGSPGVPEGGRIELSADGTVTVYAGTADHGQGHGTAFGELVADELGVPYEAVELVEGDTAFEDGVAGTFGSRSTPVAASAIAESAREIREGARRLAAEEFEADPEDVEFADGEFHVAGAPERAIDLRELAGRAAEGAFSGESLVDGSAVELDDGLAATATHLPEQYAYSFGTHVAVVEVAPDSGELSFREYVAVDDCGVQLNPMIVEGQIHGGVAQGIGQALYEEAVYDENGTLVSGSLQDYALPKAEHVPEMEVEETVTPSPITATGAKGVGEGGAVAAPPAVVNAAIDALAPFGVDDLEMPLTAETIWRAVRNERDRGLESP